MNRKRALVDLYKDIVLVTRVRIFCTALFTNNIKVMIQIDAFEIKNGLVFVYLLLFVFCSFCIYFMIKGMMFEK